MYGISLPQEPLALLGRWHSGRKEFTRLLAVPLEYSSKVAMEVSDGNRVTSRSVGVKFTTTHWSVVLAAGRDHSPATELALETLCRAYWLPLYAYVRRCGESPEDAQDLTQAFFARLLEKDWLRVASRERGRFRWFLL